MNNEYTFIKYNIMNVLDKIQYKKEILNCMRSFNVDIDNIIADYKIFDPLYKHILSCDWCDVEISRSIIFDAFDIRAWEMPCHPVEWGSSHVYITYTIEYDTHVDSYSYKGHPYICVDE